MHCNLRSTKVVFSEAEAEMLGLEIDHDDSHAARPSLRDQDFALLVHGTQPKGSEAATGTKSIKRQRFSYSRKKNKEVAILCVSYVIIEECLLYYGGYNCRDILGYVFMDCQ